MSWTLPCSKPTHMLEAMQRKTISMARLAKDPDRIARDIDSSGAIYSIKRRGERTMLLMNEDYFEGWLSVIELMKQPNWREELEQSRQDFAAGRGRDLEEVVREIGLDRRAQPRRRSAAPRSSRAGGKANPRRASRSRGRAA